MNTELRQKVKIIFNEKFIFCKNYGEYKETQRH